MKTVRELIDTVEKMFEHGTTTSSSSITLTFGVKDSENYPREGHEFELVKRMFDEIAHRMVGHKTLLWKLPHKMELHRDEDFNRTALRTRVLII